MADDGCTTLAVESHLLGDSLTQHAAEGHEPSAMLRESFEVHPLLVFGAFHEAVE